MDPALKEQAETVTAEPVLDPAPTKTTPVDEDLKALPTKEDKQVIRTTAPNGTISWNDETYELLKTHYAPGATDAELKFLVTQANELGLNPFRKECYFIPQKVWDPTQNKKVKKWSVQVGIDTFRKRGLARKDVDWHDTIPFFIAADQQAYEWRNIPRLIMEGKMPSYPDMAVSYIQPKGMSKPIKHVVYWHEYVKLRTDGTPAALWGKMPGIMLCKCAEAGAWRKAFPDQFGGMYTTDEMQQADKEPDTTQNSLVAGAAKQITAEDSRAEREVDGHDIRAMNAIVMLVEKDGEPLIREPQQAAWVLAQLFKVEAIAQIRQGAARSFVARYAGGQNKDELLGLVLKIITAPEAPQSNAESPAPPPQQ